MVLVAEALAGETADTEEEIWANESRDSEAQLMENIDSQTLSRLMSNCRRSIARSYCSVKSRTCPTRRLPRWSVRRLAR